MLHTTRFSSLHFGLSLAALGAAAFTTYVLRPPRRRTRISGIAFPPVRDAGPENMEAPPFEWDRVDEAMDESFPASDPPNFCIRSRYG